jgi:putative membrane protein
MMGQWGGMGMGWGLGMWGMGLLWLLLVAGVVIAVVALVRGLGPGRSQAPGAPPTSPDVGRVDDRASAQAILAERLARGEIEIDEYSNRSRALRER